MVWRTVAALAALWCVLVLAPAAVGGLFFAITADTPIAGPVLVLWVVGYLVQLAVFMVIARKSPHGTTPGWFLASIIPFAADWTVPVSGWGLLISAAIVVGYAIWLSYAVYRVEQLRRDGVRAVAVVVDVVRPWFNVVINRVYIRRTLRLRIERADGTPPYEVRFKGTFMLGEIPEPGCQLSVLVDPVRPQRIELVDSTDQTPPTPAYHGQAAAADIADQLRELSGLHRNGELTDDEFSAAKRRLLGF